MPTSIPPEPLTEKQRFQAIATLFARVILRLRKLQNRLEFSQQTRLTGGDQIETGRQSACNTLPALTTTHPYIERARHG